MYAWQCSEQFFQILAHLILIIRTHFKDEGSKAQTLRNTQSHVPSKWKSWNLHPNNLVPKSRLIMAMYPSVFPDFTLYIQKCDLVFPPKEVFGKMFNNIIVCGRYHILGLFL